MERPCSPNGRWMTLVPPGQPVRGKREGECDEAHQGRSRCQEGDLFGDVQRAGLIRRVAQAWGRGAPSPRRNAAHTRSAQYAVRSTRTGNRRGHTWSVWARTARGEMDGYGNGAQGASCRGVSRSWGREFLAGQGAHRGGRPVLVAAGGPDRAEADLPGRSRVLRYRPRGESHGCRAGPGADPVLPEGPSAAQLP